MLQQETSAAYFDQLKAAYDAKNWELVVEHGDRLLNLDPTYERDQVDDMMFEALYKQGMNLVDEQRMGEAVRLFDRALTIRPNDTETQHEMDLAEAYLTAIGFWGADWAQARPT
jgi:Flp pilus assembly protein TadD